MFADRNFATGLVFMAVTGVLLLAGLALLPPLLQNMYGYSVLQSGFLTAPRGIGTLISMLIAGRLTGKMDARILVGLGVVLMGTSLYMMTGFAIDQPSGPVIVSGVVQGLGLGLIFVPLQTLAFQTLAPRCWKPCAKPWPTTGWTSTCSRWSACPSDARSSTKASRACATRRVG